MNAMNNETSPKGLDYVTISDKARARYEQFLTAEQHLAEIELRKAIRAGVIAEAEREVVRCQEQFGRVMTALRDAQSRLARLGLEFTPNGSMYNQIHGILSKEIRQAMDSLDQINYRMHQAHATIVFQMKAQTEE